MASDNRSTIIITNGNVTTVTRADPSLVNVVKKPAGARSVASENLHWPGEPTEAGKVVDFTPGIDLMYCVSFRDGQTYLDAAVLAHLEGESMRTSTPSASRLSQGSSSSGCSLGRHDIVCDRDNKVIWVDGRQLVSFQAGNVILVTDVDGELRVVATDLIDVAIGEASPLAAVTTAGVATARAGHFSWVLRFLVQLREHLQCSSSVTAFMHSRVP